MPVSSTKGAAMRSNQLVTILIVVVLVLLVIFLARAVF
jgi:biopolymer transport protein ExbD